MQRAFEIALNKQSTVGHNPMVGCVIVHNNKIIGEGCHEYYGGPHAEVNAIASIPQDQHHLLQEASLYVTLEPCFHYGNTPPCVNLILKHQIPKVYISCIDTNPKVSGQSVKKMKDAGIEVYEGICEEQGKEFIRRYITLTDKKRPYIILKFAQSKDQFIGKHEETIWLTNPISKRLVHKWRSKEAAILVGTTTAAVDNPQLNTRLWEGNSPTRIVLDKNGRLDNTLHLFDGSTPTIVFHENAEVPKTTKGIEYSKINFNDKLVDQILEKLFDKKIKSLIVEGGAQTLETFIQSNLWDEARIFTTQQELKEGIPAPKINATPISELTIKEDQLIVYRNFEAR